jgi:hypothetical protein
VPELLYNTTAVPLTPAAGILDVEFSELIWAAFTVGKWRDDLFLGSRYWRYELISRFGLIRAYLRIDEDNRYVRTSAYDRLDPTEKSSVSYHLGMAIAKILAERLLQTPWLMHIDRYHSVYGVVLQQSRSRPDLFGPRDATTMNDWLVLEAKGRTNAIRKSDVQSMVKQKGRVVTVGGADPWLRGGVAAHFSNGYLEAEFVDPPPSSSERRVEAFADYVADSALFERAYYEPVMAVLETQEPTPDDPQGIRPRRIEEVDVAVGLATRYGVRSVVRPLPSVHLRVVMELTRPTRQWPVVGLLASLPRALVVARRSTGRERAASRTPSRCSIRHALAGGDAMPRERTLPSAEG